MMEDVALLVFGWEEKHCDMFVGILEVLGLNIAKTGYSGCGCVWTSGVKCWDRRTVGYQQHSESNTGTCFK
jgi:hypothetical protein